MSEKFVRLYCDDLVPFGWKCCGSCHQEWEDGYGDPSDMEETYEGRTLPEGLPEEIKLIQIFRCCGNEEKGTMLDDKAWVRMVVLDVIENDSDRVRDLR